MHPLAASNPSQRRWWIGLCLLLVLAAGLRLPGYNFSLPYIAHPDEPAFYLTGLEWRGMFDNQTYLTGYPPLYIWLNIVVQLVSEPFGIRTVAATIQMLRLISIGFNLLTLAFIALTARRAAGDLAGWIAGAAWAVSPPVIQNGGYATPDPLLYLLVIAAVWLAVEAYHGHPRWCLWSVAVGALAILDKYYILTAVAPGILVAFAIARRNRRQGTRLLLIQGAVLLATLLIALVGIAVLPREGAVARESGVTNVLNSGRVFNNVYYAIYPLQPAVFALSIGAGIIAYFIALRCRLPRIRLESVLFGLIILITVPWLAASFSLVSATERLKDVLPATTIACVLLGIAIEQLSLVIPAHYGAARVVVALPLLLVFGPQLSADRALIENRQLPDNRVALRQWADENLEPGTVLVDQENHKTFNPYWGGIEGRHWFDWWVGDSFPENTVDGWRAAYGITYAVISSDEQHRLETTDSGQSMLAQMLHLRDFTAPSRGPSFSVYRLWRMQHETQARFGDSILLLGYDQEGDQGMPGAAVNFRFYWRAAATPADNYSLFVHLLGPESDVPVAQVDGAPAHQERPTLSWNEPSETLISQPFSLMAPPETEAGRYRVVIGLYNYQTGQRLSVTDLTSNTVLGDALPLTQISIGG
jgi:hypothetical protein